MFNCAFGIYKIFKKNCCIRANRHIHCNKLDNIGHTSSDIVKVLANGIIMDSVHIKENDNLDLVYEKMSHLGANLLIKTLPSIIEGTNQRIKQDESEVTYAYNVSREEEKLDFNKTSKEVYNHIRSLYPFPTSYLMLEEKIIKITGAYIGKTTTSEPGVITNIYKDGFGISTKDNEIIITSLKPEGKKEMKASDYLNGVKKEEFIGKRVK